MFHQIYYIDMLQVYGSFLNIRILSTGLKGCVFSAACLLHGCLKVRVTVLLLFVVKITIGIPQCSPSSVMLNWIRLN
jgi:hypothetical protein